MTPALPLDSAQVSETLRPLEQATMLPPAAFTDPAVLDWELEKIFCAGWICVGHVSQVSEPGRFLMREIGRDSVVVIGGEDGRPRAFHNVCRHRGARLVTDGEGSVKRRLRCPYHAWSYDLDGALRASPHMDGVENFDPSCNGLVPVRLSTIGGLLLVDLSGDAPDPAEHIGDLLEHLERYRNAELRSGGKVDYVVPANWKGIVENYNECLHCPGVHPELNALSNYMSGEEMEGDGCLVRRLDDADGRRCGDDGERRRPRDRPAADRGALGGGAALDPLRRALPERPGLVPPRLPDAAHPLSPRRPTAPTSSASSSSSRAPSRLRASIPRDAIEFWDMTNRQDWYVCELAQKGAGSRGYTAGRYSLEETDTHAFDRMVAERYMEALRDREPVSA